MSLLQLIPKDQRPAAIAYAALELLCESSVAMGSNENSSGDEFREMLEDMLIDAEREGMIGSWRRILDRFEVTPPNRAECEKGGGA